MIPQDHIITNYTPANAASIIDLFYSQLVSQQDQDLLNLAFAKKIEQTQLDSFLQNWDIEKFGESKSLLLSYVMKANPDLKFSNYEKPRLEGLLKFHRFHNLKLISHYSKIVKEVNDKNIFPMILKGGAMKHIRADLSRPMGDIDILIPNEDHLTTTREICRRLGYEEEIPDDHSIDLHLPNSKEGTVDLHRYIDLEADYDKKFLQDLFARATLEKVFGTQAYVPCFEDLLFLGMINLARNLNNKSSLRGILYALFDFQYLVQNKKDFSWDLVRQNINQTNTHGQVLLAMKFANKIIPNLLPEELINNSVNHEKFIRHCENIIFHQFFYHEFRNQCKKLNFVGALKSKENFQNYLRKKPKYFLVKRIVRSNYLLIRLFLQLKYRS